MDDAGVGLHLVHNHGHQSRIRGGSILAEEQLQHILIIDAPLGVGIVGRVREVASDQTLGIEDSVSGIHLSTQHAIEVKRTRLSE